MSGVKLPDYTALGQQVAPQPLDRVATYSGGDAPGAAQVGFGDVMQKVGGNMQDLIDVADVNNAMANDFQPKVNALASNFYSLQGKAAMDAAPQFTQQLQDTMNDTAGKLSGQAQRMFIKSAQPLVDQHDYKAAMHAGEQGRVYAAQSNDAMMQNHLFEYSDSVISDPNAAQDAKQLGMTQLSLYMKSIGLQPDSEVYKRKMDDYEGQFDTAAVGAADQHYRALTPDQKVAAAQSLIAKPAANNNAPVGVKDVANAILGQESGNNPNAPTSVDGAVGKEQIMPDTFAQYAKPGESIVNNADRGAVFDRMMADYSERYKGDPQRMAVAYFSGPGNVAPEGSPTPWIRDVKDGNGKSTSSYVSDVNQRLGTGGDQAQGGSNIVANPSYMGIPISPDHAQKMVDWAISDKEHADKLEKINSEADFNKTQNDFFSKQHSNQLTWADIEQSKLPVQGPGGKNWWQEQLNKEVKTDPAVFNDLMQRAMMPDGSPNKLTDPKELLGNVGKGITYTDMQHIQTAMEGGDPGKEALKMFYKQGHDQLSKTSMTDIDGEGERRAYNWYMSTSKAISDGQAKGIPVQQLIDPTNKNYVGNNIGQFQEDFTKQSNNMADKIRQNMPAQPLPVEKQRRSGEGIADYNKRLGIGAPL